jgi:hypothetical protein
MNSVRSASKMTQGSVSGSRLYEVSPHEIEIGLEFGDAPKLDLQVAL